MAANKDGHVAGSPVTFEQIQAQEKQLRRERVAGRAIAAKPKPDTQAPAIAELPKRTRTRAAVKPKAE